MTNNNLVSTRERYRNSLTRLGFTIEYITDKANNIVDQLSRQYKEGNIYSLSEYISKKSDITEPVKYYIYSVVTQVISPSLQLLSPPTTPQPTKKVSF